MLVGDKIVYQISLFNDGLWLLLLALPVLLFIGFHMAKIVLGDREYATPENVVVMPPDLIWMNYTSNIDVIEEITRAVVQVCSKPPVTYEQIAPFLKSKTAHIVAQQVQEFHVYREEEIREYLRKLYNRQANVQSHGSFSVEVPQS